MGRLISNKNIDLTPKKRADGSYIFKNFDKFRPNMSPAQIFKEGSFGGTYFRPIKSGVTGKIYYDCHKKYSWAREIQPRYLTTPWADYDKDINKYGVRVGTTLDFWESKNWIVAQDPRGWMQWYCNFWAGRRTDDDPRQVKRWERLAGIKGRFRRQLITLIRRKNTQYNNFKISPKIRQTLQHWGYRLTQHDF